MCPPKSFWPDENAQLARSLCSYKMWQLFTIVFVHKTHIRNTRIGINRHTCTQAIIPDTRAFFQAILFEKGNLKLSYKLLGKCSLQLVKTLFTRLPHILWCNQSLAFKLNFKPPVFFLKLHIHTTLYKVWRMTIEYRGLHIKLVRCLYVLCETKLTEGQLEIGTQILGWHSILPLTQVHREQLADDHLSPS